ncbi:MAG: hypothetical protein ACYC1M_10645 [Armatimonadota bacterium]
MKSRFGILLIAALLWLTPLLAHAHEEEEPQFGPNAVAVQMLALPVIIVIVLVFNAFRKRK